MSIRIKGQYRPKGRIVFTRPLTSIPVFLTQPTIESVDLYSDSIFTANVGTFTPSNAVPTYRWLLNGVSISTNPTVVPNLAGSLVLEVRLSTASGSVTATTDPVDISVFPEPQAITLPSISPQTADFEQTFTATDGAYSNGTVISRQWFNNNEPIFAAQGTTLIPMVPGNLTYRVTVSGRGGSRTFISNAAVSTIPLPKFINQPSISPSEGIMGTTFTGNDGTITGATSVTRQWRLGGINIQGQTGPTYVSDGTGSLTLQVRASGPGGTVTATSPSVTIQPAPVVQNAPEFLTLPGLLGTFAEGASINIPILVEDVENNVSTWTIVGGELPGGVSLDMFSGVISGQLAEVISDTVFSFRIRVTDRTGLMTEGQFSINVSNVKTTVTWETQEGSLGEMAPGKPVNIVLGATSV